MSRLQDVTIGMVDARRNRVAMASLCAWHDDHACAAEMDAPAQVEVLAIEGDFARVSADFAEQVAAHEHARG